MFVTCTLYILLYCTSLYKECLRILSVVFITFYLVCECYKSEMKYFGRIFCHTVIYVTFITRLSNTVNCCLVVWKSCLFQAPLEEGFVIVDKTKYSPPRYDCCMQYLVTYNVLLLVKVLVVLNILVHTTMHYLISLECHVTLQESFTIVFFTVRRQTFTEVL